MINAATITITVARGQPLIPAKAGIQCLSKKQNHALD